MMAESLRPRPALAAIAALAGALALSAAIVDAKPSARAQTDQSINAADSGARLAGVGRYQLRLEEARNLLGT